VEIGDEVTTSEAFMAAGDNPDRFLLTYDHKRPQNPEGYHLKYEVTSMYKLLSM
jgi:hypothetical protein